MVYFMSMNVLDNGSTFQNSEGNKIISSENTFYHDNEQYLQWA
jgi:hypothetical protein